MKVDVSNNDIIFLRKAYKNTLDKETQASESCKELWRKTIAIFDELLERREQAERLGIEI